MMSALGRGCLEFLVVWGLAGLGLYFSLATKFSAPGPLWSGIVGGFLIAAGWGLMRNALLSRGQASLIRDSLEGAVPIGGRAYAAIGHATAIDEPLVTPFLKRPCVLYSYELSERQTTRVRTRKGSRTESQRVVYFSGMAMTHWAVQTKYGPVCVNGFPIPDQFEEVEVDTRKRGTSIREFCAETNFTRVGKWDIGKVLNFAGLVLSESTGPVRKDLWFDGADQIMSDGSSLHQCRLIEQAILLDEPICVIGKFDPMVNGLVNDLGHGGLQVLKGHAAKAIRQLQQRATTYLIFAFFSMVAAIAGSFGLLTLRERSLAKNLPSANPEQALITAFEQDDWDKFAELLSSGVSPNCRDSVGRPMLLAAIDRQKEIAVDLLLNAKADLNAAQTGWERRPIEAAFDQGHWELFKRLLAREALGDYVEKRSGTRLADEVAELENLLNSYSKSLDQGDSALMASIADAYPADYLESIERGLYKDTRPIAWDLVEGYRNGDLASFIAEGTTRGGSRERYIVTARLRDGKWKLHREYLDQRYSFRFDDSGL